MNKIAKDYKDKKADDKRYDHYKYQVKLFNRDEYQERRYDLRGMARGAIGV